MPGPGPLRRLAHRQPWTIGAGDSFLAMLVTALLGGDAPAVALARAARLASFVASQPGAVPAYDAARDFAPGPDHA